MKNYECWGDKFQTPKIVAEYMASMVPSNSGTILEPTPGLGSIVKALKGKGKIIAPLNFEEIEKDRRFDYVVMNPPFTPMAEGYRYLDECMQMSDNIIALLPWLVLINSERRMKKIQDFGFVSVTSLPRKTFPGSRIQCCILELKKGYEGNTEMKSFSW